MLSRAAMTGRSGHLLRFGVLLMAAVSTRVAGAPQSHGFEDPLNVPAVQVRHPAGAVAKPLIAVTASAGAAAAVAVGLRGVVVQRSGADAPWRQASVPVQTDLLSVHMLDERTGWASGHDAVLLQTADGGATWTRRFDRSQAAGVFVEPYQRRADAGDAAARPLFEQGLRNTGGDVSLPFLSVLFENERRGYASGSFGLLMATDDGGSTWAPWLDRIDNDEFLNLNSLRLIGGRLYITGERGTVWRLDRAREHFEAMRTGYTGTLFDITGSDRVLVAFGLRGAAYRSVDGGRTWQAGRTDYERAFTAGIVLLEDGRILLFGEDGAVFQSSDEGLSYRRVAWTARGPVYGVTRVGGQLLVVGGSGVHAAAVTAVAP